MTVSLTLVNERGFFLSVNDDIYSLLCVFVGTCVISVRQFREDGICGGRLGSFSHLVDGAVLQAVLDVVSQ